MARFHDRFPVLNELLFANDFPAARNGMPHGRAFAD